VTNQKILLKIRKWEQLLLSADPKKASKLTAKIVKGRGHVFDER
jgi:hypothetical protein